MIKWKDFHIRLHGATNWDTTPARKEGLIVAHYDFPPAAPKITTISIPGADGDIDLTDVNGVHYSNRTCTIRFTVCYDGDAAFDLNNFINTYQGQMVDFNVLRNDYYNTGRMVIDSVDRSVPSMLRFSATIDATPFRVEDSLMISNHTILENIIFRQTSSGATNYVNFKVESYTGNSANIMTDGSLNLYGNRLDEAVFSFPVTIGKQYLFTGNMCAGEFRLENSSGELIENESAATRTIFVAQESKIYIRLISNGKNRSYDLPGSSSGQLLSHTYLYNPILIEISGNVGLHNLGARALDVSYNADAACWAIVNCSPTALTKNEHEKFSLLSGESGYATIYFCNQRDGATGGNVALTRRMAVL